MFLYFYYKTKTKRNEQKNNNKRKKKRVQEKRVRGRIKKRPFYILKTRNTSSTVSTTLKSIYDISTVKQKRHLEFHPFVRRFVESDNIVMNCKRTEKTKK